MDFKSRERTMLHQQENAYAGKPIVKMPAAQKGLQAPKRTALGDRSNVNGAFQAAQAAALKTKIVQLPSEDEKKVLGLRPITRSYKNVSAKVDTGHTVKLPALNLRANKENVPKIVPRDEGRSLVSKTTSLTTQLRQTKISATSKSSTESLEAKTKDVVKLHKYSIVRKPSETKETAVPVVKSKHEAYSTELLEGVEDIDSAEGNSPIFMGIYIKDIYNYLMELETVYPIEKDHLGSQVCMTPKMRATLIDWLVEVHEQFSLILETLHLTVAIIDRYLQVVSTVQRKHIQLIGITAMFIACKYEEMLIPDIRDFTFITDNSYTRSEVLRCERAMLNELGFCLGRPLPVHFERRFIKAAKVHAKVHYLAKYLIDLSLIEYDMAHLRPSKVAAASVCLSMSLLSPHTPPRKCWSPTLVHYSGYKYDDISLIIKQLASVALASGSTRFKAVMNKYNSSRHGKVPMYPELKGTMIRNIAGESPKS